MAQSANKQHGGAHSLSHGPRVIRYGSTVTYHGLWSLSPYIVLWLWPFLSLWARARKKRKRSYCKVPLASSSTRPNVPWRQAQVIRYLFTLPSGQAASPPCFLASLFWGSRSWTLASWHPGNPGPVPIDGETGMVRQLRYKRKRYLWSLLITRTRIRTGTHGLAGPPLQHGSCLCFCWKMGNLAASGQGRYI